VIDWLVQLGRDLDRKFMIRLVKGAYWDSEIKHAQEMGYTDYPVFTRKPSTDLSYQVCAERLMNARDVIYPQFATHNAYTVALIRELAGTDRDFEFQRLHGMGALMYDQLQDTSDTPYNLRVYAPVGAHKDLLPYLVRRLLENGANSSFVNRFMDKELPVEELMQDTIDLVKAASPRRHGLIPVPKDILRASGLEPGERDNSHGIDLANVLDVNEMREKMTSTISDNLTSGPIIGGTLIQRNAQDVLNPTDVTKPLGKLYESTPEDMEQAMALSTAAWADWDALGGQKRADILNKAADIMEADMERLMSIIAREGGRTLNDGVSEVREACDFLRYYALQAVQHFGEPQLLPGPTGERNEISLHGRGTFLCIAPWNFPLAIFVGQVAAALAAGNAVISKPAEQTPLIAAEAVRILHKAGVPGDVLHLIPARGSQIGKVMVPDERISGIAFTGSTDTAQVINRTLADRNGAIAPLIAETGGQNVMIVDSTALPEQVVDDVISSAFQSAGQRCSALRVLYLQEDIADNVLEMLQGAADALVLGDPNELNTDIGPVIDEGSRKILRDHVARMEKEAKVLKQLPTPEAYGDGTFFGPTIIEIDHINQLHEEIFGPVLHVIRYKARNLDQVLEDIRGTGFGLTMGIHSRIEGRAQEIFSKLGIGNTYVNRNIVGAVVGVQPFGGQGLSGTGPKAGGPRYLFRFATEKTLSINTVATGGNTELFSLDDSA